MGNIIKCAFCISEVEDEKLTSINEKDMYADSNVGSEKVKEVELEMMENAIPVEENVATICDRVEESDEDLCHLEIGKVIECAKEHKPRHLIAGKHNKSKEFAFIPLSVIHTLRCLIF